MTQREFYTTIIEKNISDEITEKAKALLASVDAKNSRSAKNSADKRNTNTEIGRKLFSVLEVGKTYTMDEILVQFAAKVTELTTEYGFKMNSSKFTAIARNCQDAGFLEIIKETPNKYRFIG